MKLGCLIIDEAQSIKNHTTKVSECVKSLKAAYKIALSGFVFLLFLIFFFHILLFTNKIKI